MIEDLRQWVLTIAGVAVFGSICDIILPGGNFRKYIRLAVGLVLILTMLTPIQKLIFKSRETDDFLSETDFNSIALTVDNMDRQNISKLYRDSLEKNIKQKLSESLNSTEIDVKCSIEEDNKENFGKINAVEVVISEKIPETDINKIKTELKQIYSVSPQTVNVKYKKGISK